MSLRVNATIIPNVGDRKFLALMPKRDTAVNEDLVPAHMYRVFKTAPVLYTNDDCK